LSDIIEEMTVKRSHGSLLARLGLAVGVLLVVGPLPAASATKLHPGASEYAWYWEDQRSDTIKGPGDTEIVEYRFQNPFCPETPAGGVQELCKAGRLPVEVRNGDYKEPNKISAVAFDFTLVPFGSKVKKFTATLTEANDEQSEPINAANKSLRACRITEFFGTGEAREYKEAPSFSCSKSAPTARRKAVGKGDKKIYEFTFDLTAYAKGWAKQGSLITGVMLFPVKPKHKTATDGIGFGGGDEESEQSTTDNWRVVLKGPREKQGIQTTLVFTKPKLSTPIPPTPPPTTSFNGSGTSPGFSDFGSGTTDFSPPASDATTPSSEVPSALPTPTPASTPVDALDDKPASAAAEETPVEGFPWYMWLALLAGIVGFSMVRSIVIERVTGIRPDGVLAHIHRLNADRRGAALQSDALGGPGLLAPLATAFRPIGRGLAAVGRSARGLIGKVRKGG
jgi:hypothetical protein